jgi:diguanylate cyclase (GGDEF)-like protein
MDPRGRWRDNDSLPVRKNLTALGGARASRAHLGAILLLASLGLPARHALALDPAKLLSQYTHQAWKAEEGLPQSYVKAIAQTKDGYLWLGTEGGLARFDGVRFAVFDERNAPALRGSDILALCATSDGSLWIGLRGGGAVRYSSGAFTGYTAREGLPSDVVRSLYEDSSGRLWIGTDGGAVLFRGGRFVAAYPNVPGREPDTVMAIAESGGDLWFATYGAGLRRLHQGVVTTFDHTRGLSSDLVRCLYADRDGGLWIGTRGGGFGKLRADRFTPYSLHAGNWATIGTGGIKRDRDGNLWIGTVGGGLLRLQAGERIAAYTKSDGLASDVVDCVFEDREGILWIGTEGEGLHSLKDGKVTTFGLAEGLSGNDLFPIFEDRARTLWLGSRGGGLNALRDGRISAYTKRQGLSSDVVKSLAEDREGNLWIGTDGGGLDRLRDGRFRHYGTGEGLSDDRVIALLCDRQNNLWIGTYGGGLNLLRDGKISVFGTRDGMSSAAVLSLTEDREGTLWIGTDGGGLNHLRAGAFTVLSTKDGLVNDVVQAVHEDAQGVLWIGTAGGLSRLQNGRFTSYTWRTGLLDDSIYQILEDEQNNLWMSCNKGIFRVAKAELNDVAEGRAQNVHSSSFGTADGMKSSECNGSSQPAGWKAHDGALWFPTTEGAVRIDPLHLPSNPLPPPVSIEDVLINRHRYPSSASLSAPPGGGEIEIHYAALSMLDPKKVLFRYRLRGFDSSWIEAGVRRVAYYTNTPPGRYRFEVIACNNDGVWNEAGAGIDVYLQPHFYQTYWFLGLCVLAAVVAGVVVHKFRVRTLTRRKHELTRLVAERTRQLEEANEILRQLSSQDGLTGLSNRRHFDEALTREWRRALRSRGPISLLMLDIDGFKAYNDSNGHQEGDECLKSVATALRDVLKRSGDLCARYGGEEFAVILPETGLDGAARVAETLRATVEALQIPHPKGPISPVVTVSIGAHCLFPNESTNPAALISGADMALYMAKQTGRNRACLADPVASASSRTM